MIVSIYRQKASHKISIYCESTGLMRIYRSNPAKLSVLHTIAVVNSQGLGSYCIGQSIDVEILSNYKAYDNFERYTWLSRSAEKQKKTTILTAPSFSLDVICLQEMNGA